MTSKKNTIYNYIIIYNKIRIQIFSKTWIKDSYELIDFYSKELNEQSLEIKSSGYIVREQNEIDFSETELENSEKILEVQKKQGGYELNLNEYDIDKEYNITTPNSTWFLLRKEFMDDRTNEYNIKEGDILKIGRILIRIKTIKFSKNNKNNKTKTKTESNQVNDKQSINTNFSQNLKEIQTIPNHHQIKEPKEIDTTKLCRICYGEEETPDNPLVQPCICSGSMKYIHLNCLKTWINTSVNIKLESTEYCNVYTYKPAECELCKTNFPDFIRHRGKLYEILDFYSDFDSFLIFECLITDKTLNKFIYVVNLDIPNNKINFGRGHSSNVLLNDISVSRLHCFLKIDKHAKKIFISDNNSKFGTLVLVQNNNLNLSYELALFLQIGRTYLKMILKKNNSFFGCCGISEKKNADFYYLQNYDKHKFENKLTVKTEFDTSELGEIENKLDEIKSNGNEINNDIINMKTKINLMEDNDNYNDNDIEGLLLNTPAIDANENNNLNNNINNDNINDNINDLIDKESIKENNNDKESSIVVKDNE